MVQELSKGANCPVPSPVVTVSVACASPVDVSALLVADGGQVRSDADLIFYNAPTGPGVRYLDAAHGPSGVDATVTTGSATTYSKRAEATSAALVVGRCLTVRGPAGSDGTIAARSIAVRPANSGQCSGGGASNG